MKRIAVSLLLAVVVLATACAAPADYSARFVRYERLQDGSRVAIITPLSQENEEQTAYADAKDLEPGDVVRVRAMGRDWDQPQWKPAREVVGTD